MLRGRWAHRPAHAEALGKVCKTSCACRILACWGALDFLPIVWACALQNRPCSPSTPNARHPTTSFADPPEARSTARKSIRWQAGYFGVTFFYRITARRKGSYERHLCAVCQAPAACQAWGARQAAGTREGLPNRLHMSHLGSHLGVRRSAVLGFLRIAQRCKARLAAQPGPRRHLPTGFADFP